MAFFKQIKAFGKNEKAILMQPYLKPDSPTVILIFFSLVEAVIGLVIIEKCLTTVSNSQVLFPL